MEIRELHGLFQCQYCKDVKWQPVLWHDAQPFSAAVRTNGIEEAYRQALSRKRRIRNIIIAVQMLSTELEVAVRESEDEDIEPVVKRRRGRPRKESYD